jgi:glycosyltransferase involved in cell wall biosynthesis
MCRASTPEGDTKRMTRQILIFHASAELYGSDQTVLDLVRGCVGSFTEVHVALPREGPLVGKLLKAGALVHKGQFHSFGRRSIRGLRALASIASVIPDILKLCIMIKKVNPDIVHVNTVVIPTVAIASRIVGVPVVWHVHEVLDRQGVVAKVLALCVSWVPNKIICNSIATKDALLVHSERARAKTGVVYNGTNSHTSGMRQETRRALGLDEEKFVFLFLGRLNKWKGQGLFLEAAREVCASQKAVRFIVSGDCPPGQDHYRDEFLSQVSASGIEDQISWLGFQEKIDPLLSACDALVVPSLSPEPFGLVAIEAMAAGLPVIAANHGGLSEIVTDGITGLHFDPGDRADLARKMLELVADQDGAKKMGAKGAARQEEFFSVVRYQEAMRAVYTSLCREAQGK